MSVRARSVRGLGSSTHNRDPVVVVRRSGEQKAFDFWEIQVPEQTPNVSCAVTLLAAPSSRTRNVLPFETYSPPPPTYTGQVRCGKFMSAFPLHFRLLPYRNKPGLDGDKASYATGWRGVNLIDGSRSCRYFYGSATDSDYPTILWSMVDIERAPCVSCAFY